MSGDLRWAPQFLPSYLSSGQEGVKGKWKVCPIPFKSKYFELSILLLFLSYWSQLIPMCTPSCKGGWEMSSVCVAIWVKLRGSVTNVPLTVRNVFILLNVMSLVLRSVADTSLMCDMYDLNEWMKWRPSHLCNLSVEFPTNLSLFFFLF